MTPREALVERLCQLFPLDRDQAGELVELVLATVTTETAPTPTPDNPPAP